MKESEKLEQSNDRGVFKRIADHMKLVWLLWKDPRISLFLKILPLGSIIYLISPLDIVIPVVDDVGVLWFFTYLFVELSPEDIVEEHRQAILSTVEGEWSEEIDIEIDEENIEDAEFHEKKD